MENPSDKELLIQFIRIRYQECLNHDRAFNKVSYLECEAE